MSELSQQDIQGLINLIHSGQFATAERRAKELIDSHRNEAILYDLLGVALYGIGKLKESISNYHQALNIRPNEANVHVNLSISLMGLHRMEEAVASLRQALTIEPSFDRAHYELGLALSKQGKVREGVDSYLRALKIKPDNAEVYNNLGQAFRLLGRLPDAMASYDQALKLKALDVAYFNMHSHLLNPVDMSQAIRCLETALKLQPSINKYKFFLGMLLEYVGQSVRASSLLADSDQWSKSDKADLDAWNYIKSAKIMPKMIGSEIEGFQAGINAARKSGLVLEFGVRFGVTISQIASLTSQQVHGFDSFHGLPEEWGDLPIGVYSTGGVIPKLPDNVRLHIGLFENTLPEFIRNNVNEPVRFMNIDCDIYSSTKTVLDCLASQIVPGTVIAFDEYLGNESWREDEHKAFMEAASAYGWTYEYLTFSMNTGQVVVKIQ